MRRRRGGRCWLSINAESKPQARRLKPTEREGSHAESEANDDNGGKHRNQSEKRVSHHSLSIGDEALRVNDESADSHQHQGQAQAEAHQQNQPKPGMAESNRAEHKHQRRWARNESAADAERDQAPQRDVTFRHVTMRPAAIVAVHVRAVRVFMRVPGIMPVKMRVRS